MKLLAMLKGMKKSDKRPMFLKAPSKLPKRLFSPHNKNLKMPKNLIERYRKKDK